MCAKQYKSYFTHKRVLVTGGAGFIGSHLVQALVLLGADVTVLDNFSTGSYDNLSSIISKITIVVGDILDATLMQSVCSGQEIIFHLAAFVSVADAEKYGLACVHTNVQGTVVVLDAIRACSPGATIVFASSAAVYGAQDGICVESAVVRPLSIYGLSKYMGEQLVNHYKSAHGIMGGSLRFFNVWGERQLCNGASGSFMVQLRYRMAHNLPIVIYGDGLQTRDFVPVDAVVDALLCYASRLTRTDAPAVCNVGTGIAKTLIDIIHEVKRDYPQYVERIIFDAPRPGDVRHSYASCGLYRQWCM